MLQFQENKMTEHVNEHHRGRPMRDNGISGGIYGMAFIGALVYYIQQATTIWIGILGFFKALFWPAMLMYKLLEYLKM
jgi:hypothetical protein